MVQRHVADSNGDKLVSKMNQIRPRQPTRWDSREITGKRVNKRQRSAILKRYEKGMEKGEDRSKLLATLAADYDKSERQIERYIQQAREERQRERQVTKVAAPLAAHYDDVRKASGDWFRVMQTLPPALFNPAALREPSHFGYGLRWEEKSGGEGVVARLAVEDSSFFPALRVHLNKPIVDKDFWELVKSLKQSGTTFLEQGRRVGEQIAKTARDKTGLDTIVSWESEPKEGIPAYFGETISSSALGIENYANYSYGELAIVYLESGIVLTQVAEGVRLLNGEGFDPSVTTMLVSPGSLWAEPRSDNLRVVCGPLSDLTRITGRPVRFVLKFGPYSIAVGTLEQIRCCRGVHETMMHNYAYSEEVKIVPGALAEIESISTVIMRQLERATHFHSFPGRCPLCP